MAKIAPSFMKPQTLYAGFPAKYFFQNSLTGILEDGFFESLQH